MMEKNINILIVGSGAYPIYETAVYNAFVELGYKNTKLFTWKSYLESMKLGTLSRLSTKCQNKYQYGPRINKMNDDLLKLCKEFCPKLIFVYSGILIYGSTIRKIKKNIDTKVFYYNNDDPFAVFYPKYHWRHYRNALKYADFSFVYREKNIVDIKKRYDLPCSVLKSYYIDTANYPINNQDKLENIPDVVFLGHFENDERSEYLKALTDSGISVGVPMEHIRKFQVFNDRLIPISNSHTEYNRVLCSCKIPLIFLSKINHDTYTRRCFEIPAAGALIFCPYTENMASMFKEDKEAVYYHNKEEFVEKICYYLKHDAERETIAKAGRERLLKDGHEVKDRVQKIIGVYEELVREDDR